jgi:hypothetical protein
MNHTGTANGATIPASDQGVAAGLRDRADPRLVFADRVEQLYSQVPLGVVATLVIGLIAAIELREGRFIELVYFWGALVVLVSVLHALLYQQYRRNAANRDQAAQWMRWLGIGAFAAGATWGFATSARCSSPSFWQA